MRVAIFCTAGRRLKPIIAFLGYDPLPPAEMIGERLVRYRWLRGWTQEKMAARLRVDPSTLARWERDEREPSGDFRSRVERVLGESARTSDLLS